MTGKKNKITLALIHSYSKQTHPLNRIYPLIVNDWFTYIFKKKLENVTEVFQS